MHGHVKMYVMRCPFCWTIFLFDLLIIEYRNFIYKLTEVAVYAETWHTMTSDSRMALT